MAFAETLKKTWKENLLFSALVELTYRCNLDCFFCYNDLALKGTPMRVDDYFHFFEDLCDMEVMNLILSGGEPLAHPDFLTIGRKARELGFVVRIKSNGHALRGKLAQRIKEEIDPFIIETSLHGACAETHDRQTRVPGSFDRLMANLREILALGLRVNINSALTVWNEKEIEGMFAIAESLGCRMQFDPEVTPRDDGDKEPLSISPTAEGLRQLFRFERERAEAAKKGKVEGVPSPSAVAVVREGDDHIRPASTEKHCGAGSSGIAVDPFGNVYPCVQWRRPIGNLHQSSIKQIWAGSSAIEEIRRLTVEAKKMLRGEGAMGALLNFCPGSAALNTGSPLRIHEEARRRAALREEVLKGGTLTLPLHPGS